MKQPKVLIADDDRAMRSVLRTRLAAWGYTAVEAVDGLGVLAAAAGGAFSAVILDQGMPRGEGTEVARLIRKECAVPIIFVSGRSTEVRASIAGELANVHVLGKPLEAEVLRGVLAEAVGQPMTP